MSESHLHGTECHSTPTVPPGRLTDLCCSTRQCRTKGRLTQCGKEDILAGQIHSARDKLEKRDGVVPQEGKFLACECELGVHGVACGALYRYSVALRNLGLNA